MSRDAIVLKLGGSILCSEESLVTAVHEIYRYVRDGRRVVAVASARKGTTDRLDSEARRICPDPEPESYASLLASGEARSAAALALATHNAGLSTKLLDAHRLRLVTTGSPLDAEPAHLESRTLMAAIERCSVVVVPGFVGCGVDGAPTLLGRGGSDMTALFLASALGADCHLAKDVDGWYVGDPGGGLGTLRYRTLSWADAIARPAPVVQDKAVRLAARLGQRFTVGAVGSTCPTEVGSPTTHAEREPAPCPPLDVVLLGLGTVGYGVYRHLMAQPECFRLRAVLVRDLRAERPDDVDRSLLTDRADEILEAGGDVVIETLGGFEPAHGLVTGALLRGRTVISSNRELLERAGTELDAVAAARGGRLLYSAATGGAAPMLETVHRWAGEIERLRGVLNGTTNWILGEIASGRGFDESVRQAQALGFTEADPTNDLCGLDAARKLVLLARAAWNEPLSLGDAEIEGIEALAERPLDGPAPLRRLVATCERGSTGRLEPRVALEELDEDDPLAGVQGEWNALVLEHPDGGRTLVRGRGTGRWPTAESVLGDLLSVHRDRGREAAAPIYKQASS